MVESILYMNEIVDSIPFRRLFHAGHTKILIYTMPLCQFFFQVIQSIILSIWSSMFTSGMHENVTNICREIVEKQTWSSNFVLDSPFSLDQVL